MQLLGSGTIFREAMHAAKLLQADWSVEADLWSCPSFNELARDGADTTRWNMLHPSDKPRISHVTQCLTDTRGPVIVATDYIRLFGEQIRSLVPAGRNFTVLGTDGFGRSDTREKLRHFFEVDRFWIVLATLTALAQDGQFDKKMLAGVIKKYGLDAEKPNPISC